MTYHKILLIVYIIYIILISLITFVLFKKDKEKAKNGEMRTKEKTLLFFSAFGGGIGAFIGRIICKHKTDKKYFSIVIYLSLILEILILALFIYGGLIKWKLI